jgi:uncharacterized protein YdiU (UPF0061 family)
MTIFFRLLSKINKNNTAEKALSIVNEAFYIPTEIQNKIKDAWINWFTKYITRLNLETSSNEEKVKQMNLVNPKYVLRNYMAQLAIDDANKGEYKLIEELYQLLKQPYAEQTESEKWFTKRPEWARQKIGCSMLSCSS